MRNVQQRVITAPIHVVGALIDTVGSADDKVWPASWPPMILDRGLAVGSAGGHGPIRYSVAEYEPGVRARFDFAEGLGLVGYHELTVTPVDSERTLLTHVIAGRLEGSMRLAWPLAIRWLHEALLRDLLDTAELSATGHLAAPKKSWSPLVRLLRKSLRRTPAPVSVAAR